MATTVIIAWLSRLGVIPGSDPTESSPTAPSTPTAAEPFTVAVDSSQDSTLGWVVPQPPGQFKEPVLGPNQEKDYWTTWAEEVGAIPAEVGTVSFTIQGRSAAEVRLTGMTARVTDWRPALSGTHVLLGGADIGEFRWIAVDLDADPPRVTTVYDPTIADIVDAPTHENRPVKWPYDVSISDAETFNVRARVTQCDCSWQLELSWTSEGRTGTYVINAGGRPFRTTGTSNVVATCVVNNPQPCK